MKQFILSFLVLFFFLTSYCQIIKPVKISLAKPIEAKTLSYDQFVKLSNIKFNKSLSTDQHFQDGHLLINYRERPVFKLEQSLKYKENELMGILRRSSEIKNLNSEIVSVNDHRFLLIRYVQENNNFISFISETDDRSIAINGHIQYKNSDVNEADKFLPVFLKSFKFQ